MKEILEKVTTTEATATDFWIKDSKINSLLKQAEEIRINGSGNLEIYSMDVKLELKLGKSIFHSDKKTLSEKTAHAQIVSINIGNESVYGVTAIECSKKSCEIL